MESMRTEKDMELRVVCISKFSGDSSRFIKIRMNINGGAYTRAILKNLCKMLIDPEFFVSTR